MNAFRRRWFCTVVLASLLVLLAAIVQSHEDPARTVLSELRTGPTVTLKDVAGRYEIALFEGTEIGQRLTEVRTDCIFVDDAAGVLESTFPAYSIKASGRIKRPKK